ncbi:MAG: hypothetical protein JNN03_00105 [Rubrivivax sp.]|nr:hypothetical protein [Rubrivivax sp.]
MHADTIGWVAAALMVATFSCREARALRPLAVATNVAFIGYGLMASLPPVLVLHMALLPINLWRCLQAYGVGAKALGEGVARCGWLLCTIALASLPLLAGCGGGDDASSPALAPPSPSLPSTPPAAAAPNTVGAAGGTVASGDGAEVSVPAGALAQEVAIDLAADTSGAPALPEGLLALGKVHAFTPHGTTFAVPARVTVPFDPALLKSGMSPVLYKVEASGAAAGQWREVEGATLSGTAMSAPVDSFSFYVVAPPLEFRGITRQWKIFKTGFHWPEPTTYTNTSSIIGAVSDESLFGPVHLRTEADYARGLIYGNATGSTYWLGASTPAQAKWVDPTGGAVEYRQQQVFRKRDASATLSFTLSRAWVRAKDFDPRPAAPGRFSCLSALIVFEVEGWDRSKGQVFFHRKGSFVLFGHYGQWFWTTYSSSAQRLWGDLQFANTLGANPAAVSVELLEPIKVAVPLESVDPLSTIELKTQVRIVVQDFRQNESGVEAFLRDPQALDGPGMHFEFTGLDHTGVPAVPSPAYAVESAPACPGAAEPAAGALQFEHAAFVTEEGALPGALVVVTRTGGARGWVSARVTTGFGTAMPGVHYTPVSEHVAFADGDDSPRVVFVPIAQDLVAEADRSVPLQLTDVRGCAKPGATTQATLTIVDDDSPPAPPVTYRVGGNVMGLVGTGLVLEDRMQLLDLPVAANGSFEFGGNYAGGAAYDVRVKSPPVNPSQICTVARGAGTMGSASVADIEVTCTTPPPPSGLDTSFGTLGKVVDGLPGGARAIARQSTGHILATNGASLVRYHPDGRLDTSFGGGAGKVDNLLTGTGAEVADLAVGGDDRIVVAGRILQPAKSPPFYQMAAARLLPDGTRDASFGSSGMATFRLAGVGENATRVLMQPDGRVVLVGQATPLNGPGGQANNDIAVVRLTTDGAVDASFGTGGATLADAFARDFAFAAALQPDGRISVAGRTSPDNAQPEDTLFTRLTADGAIEPGFGRNPAYSTLSDEAVDVALQPDGKLVLLVVGRSLNAEILLVRLNGDGSADTAFGSNGIARRDIGPHDDLPRAVALQPDGKIVVAAQVSNGSPVPPSFAVLRFGSDGAVDATFGSDGVLRVPFFGGLDSANDLLVQPDGRVVVAGSWRGGLGAGIALVRIVP